MANSTGAVGNHNIVRKPGEIMGNTVQSSMRFNIEVESEQILQSGHSAAFQLDERKVYLPELNDLPVVCVPLSYLDVFPADTFHKGESQSQNATDCHTDPERISCDDYVTQSSGYDSDDGDIETGTVDGFGFTDDTMRLSSAWVNSRPRHAVLRRHRSMDSCIPEFRLIRLSSIPEHQPLETPAEDNRLDPCEDLCSSKILDSCDISSKQELDGECLSVNTDQLENPEQPMPKDPRQKEECLVPTRNKVKGDTCDTGVEKVDKNRNLHFSRSLPLTLSMTPQNSLDVNEMTSASENGFTGETVIATRMAPEAVASKEDERQMNNMELQAPSQDDAYVPSATEKKPNTEDGLDLIPRYQQKNPENESLLHVCTGAQNKKETKDLCKTGDSQSFMRRPARPPRAVTGKTQPTWVFDTDMNNSKSSSNHTENQGHTTLKTSRSAENISTIRCSMPYSDGLAKRVSLDSSNLSVVTCNLAEMAASCHLGWEFKRKNLSRQSSEGKLRLAKKPLLLRQLSEGIADSLTLTMTCNFYTPFNSGDTLSREISENGINSQEGAPGVSLKEIIRQDPDYHQQIASNGTQETNKLKQMHTNMLRDAKRYPKSAKFKRGYSDTELQRDTKKHQKQCFAESREVENFDNKKWVNGQCESSSSIKEDKHDERSLSQPTKTSELFEEKKCLFPEAMAVSVRSDQNEESRMLKETRLHNMDGGLVCLRRRTMSPASYRAVKNKKNFHRGQSVDDVLKIWGLAAEGKRDESDLVKRSSETSSLFRVVVKHNPENQAPAYSNPDLCYSGDFAAIKANIFKIWGIDKIISHWKSQVRSAKTGENREERTSLSLSQDSDDDNDDMRCQERSTAHQAQIVSDHESGCSSFQHEQEKNISNHTDEKVSDSYKNETAISDKPLAKNLSAFNMASRMPHFITKWRRRVRCELESKAERGNSLSETGNEIPQSIVAAKFKHPDTKNSSVFEYLISQIIAGYLESVRHFFASEKFGPINTDEQKTNAKGPKLSRLSVWKLSVFITQWHARARQTIAKKQTAISVAVLDDDKSTGTSEVFEGFDANRGGDGHLLICSNCHKDPSHNSFLTEESSTSKRSDHFELPGLGNISSKEPVKTTDNQTTQGCKQNCITAAGGSIPKSNTKAGRQNSETSVKSGSPKCFLDFSPVDDDVFFSGHSSNEFYPADPYELSCNNEDKYSTNAESATNGKYKSPGSVHAEGTEVPSKKCERENVEHSGNVSTESEACSPKLVWREKLNSWQTKEVHTEVSITKISPKPSRKNNFENDTIESYRCHHYESRKSTECINDDLKKSLEHLISANDENTDELKMKMTDIEADFDAFHDTTSCDTEDEITSAYRISRKRITTSTVEREKTSEPSSENDDGFERRIFHELTSSDKIDSTNTERVETEMVETVIVVARSSPTSHGEGSETSHQLSPESTSRSTTYTRVCHNYEQASAKGKQNHKLHETDKLKEVHEERYSEEYAHSSSSYRGSSPTDDIWGEGLWLEKLRYDFRQKELGIEADSSTGRKRSFSDVCNDKNGHRRRSRKLSGDWLHSPGSVRAFQEQNKPENRISEADHAARLPLLQSSRNRISEEESPECADTIQKKELATIPFLRHWESSASCVTSKKDLTENATPTRSIAGSFFNCCWACDSDDDDLQGAETQEREPVLQRAEHERWSKQFN